LLVPSGPLTSLPFQVLVTAPPREGQQASWLIQSHALTVLPSVASLVALRRYAKPSRATRPFIGFGDPLLVGRFGVDKRAWDRQICPSVGERGPVRVAAEPAQRFGQLFRGGLADVAGLRRQPPLPETADELCAVARLLGADVDANVYLGDRARETRIKALSTDGALAKAHIVHFATHGLLAGETKWFNKEHAEPALILTPPETASEEDDGLLTASEVAGLKLDADWVIMSACNTAGPAGDDAEALSGLARAFFYAGARALLVSHWYVDSNATVALITRAFSALEADKKLGRAEALRGAMRALIDAGGRTAHPAYWAPFVVVGEGGAGR
jgi:CHAT domain-containing protein